MAMSRRAKRRLGLLVLGVCVIAASGAGAVSLLSMQRAQENEAKRVRGLEAYRQGRYEEALANLGSVFGRDRSDLEAALAIADARRRVPLENAQHLISSQAFAMHALELDPGNVEALGILLDDYAALGRRTELLDVASRLLELEPDNAEAHSAKVQALLALGRRDEAVAAAEAMVAAQPARAAALALYVATRSMAGASDEELLAHVEAAHAEHPQDAAFATLLAEMRWRVGDREGAQESARQAASLDLSDPALLDDVIGVLDRVGLTDEATQLALRYAREIDAATPERAGETVVVATERAWRVGDLEQATQAIEAALSTLGIEGASEDVLGWALLLAADAPQREGGEATFDTAQLRAAMEGRDSLRAGYWRDALAGADAMRAGDLVAARDHIRGALMRQPDERLPAFMLAQTEARLGDLEAAAARFAALAAREPTWYSARRMQARTLLELGRADEAHTAARLLLTAHPTRLDAALQVLETGAVLAEAGLADLPTVDALALLGDRVAAELADAQPGVAATALLRAGRALAAAGQPEEVQRRIDRVLALSEHAAASEAVALALTCRRFGAPGAERLLALAQERAPNSPQVVHALALSAADAGQSEAGKRIFDEALARASEDEAAELRRRRALYLERVGDAEALAALREVAQSRPDDARAQLALLQSARAWADERIVAEALSRLGGILGQGSPTWRVQEARRLLTFERSEANASKVVTLLADIVRNDPSEALAAALFAEAQLLLDRNVRPAAEALARAVDANPKQAALYPALILTLRDAGRLDDANRRLRDFAALTDVPEPLRRRRAALLRSFGMQELAAAELEQLADTGAAADLAALAEVRLAQGDTAAAAQAYTRIEADTSAGVDPLLAAAVFFARVGEGSRAQRLLDRAADQAGDDARLVRAVFASRLGRGAEAESLLRQATRGAANASAHGALAQLLIRRGAFEEADAALREALEALPQSRRLRTLERMSQVAQRGETWADAVWLLLDEPAALDEFASPTAEALEAIEARHDESDAGWREMAERARELPQRHPMFYPGWALAIQALGRTSGADSALTLARDATRRFASDPRPARIATQLLLQMGRLEEAGAMAEQWRSRPGADTRRVDLILADVDVRRDRPAQALRRLAPLVESIMSQAAEDPQAASLLLRVRVAAGSVAEALATLEELAARDIRWWGDGVSAAGSASPVRARRWLIALDQALPEEARAKLAVPLADAWWRVATATSNREDIQRVASTLEREASQTSGSLDVAGALLLAVSLEQLGRLSDAQRWYRETLRQAPTQHAALNNLAYLLLKTGGDAAEAVELAQRALEALADRGGDASSRANYLDTLGSAQLAAGQAREAQAAFRQAINIGAPPPPGAHLGLAEALAALGDLAGAREALRAFRFANGQTTPGAYMQSRLERLERALAEPGG